MTQPTEQQGNQPESSEQPVYQPAPAWAPQFSAAAPAIPNGSSATSGIATANGHATVCAIAYVGPGTSSLPVSTVTAGPGLCFSPPLPNPAMAQPNQPSVAQERFGRSSGRLTASQVIETCATILAGVILLGLAWTNPQPYAPVDLIAGLSGAAALIVGVRLLQAPLIYGTVILIVSTVTVLWPWRAEFSRHYWWVWLALGGIILIVAAARYEASLKSMRTIAARIGDLR